MNRKKYTWVLYLIATTIFVTIAIQLYWNYKNYEENKRQLNNEIQLSFDNAIEEYYAGLAKSDYLTLLETQGDVTNLPKNHPLNKKVNIQISKIDFSKEAHFSNKGSDSIVEGLTNGLVKIIINDSLKKRDSHLLLTKITGNSTGYNVDTDGNVSKVKIYQGKKASDSIRLIKNLKPIFISFLRDSIDYNVIDSLLKNQLHQKKIELHYAINHLKDGQLFYQTKHVSLKPTHWEIRSKSTYLRGDEQFKLLYDSPNLIALKRGFTGILLSLLLAIAVISSLFYLLKIINRQKELAEIKNDLISNITHEFKTPITTVSTALEALDTFNVIDDKEKTKKYLSMSSVQLKKLQLMVEKLLETATLDSEKLLLKKEPVNIVALVEKITKKYRLIETEKEICFSSNVDDFLLEIDPFHFENAISNLIDNALKYGGSEIKVNINKELNATKITIADNGLGIDKSHRDKIFNKFYRIPKGNTHDVKGFGIGLYYTKKIIEKHDGSISLVPNSKNTIFKIILPNE